MSIQEEATEQAYGEYEVFEAAVSSNKITQLQDYVNDVAPQHADEAYTDDELQTYMDTFSRILRQRTHEEILEKDKGLAERRFAPAEEAKVRDLIEKLKAALT